MKKIFLFFAILTYSQAFAQFAYTVDGDKITITGTGEMPERYSKTIESYSNIIETAVISEGITSICPCLFMDFKYLHTVDLPEGIESIETGAFQRSIVRNITLPQSLTNLGSAFCECSNLEAITIPGGLKNISMNCFSYCQGLQSVIIEEGVENIGHSAFSNDKKLTDITFPSTIKTIGSASFCGCPLSEKLELPEGLATIGSIAFSGCTNIKDVKIPSTVTQMEDEIFTSCPNIATIRCMAQTPPKIESSTFKSLYETVILYVPSESIDAYRANDSWNQFTNIFSLDDFGKRSGTCGNDLIWELNGDDVLTITGTGSVSSFPWNAYKADIKKVVIGEGVTSLPSKAFENYKLLESVVFPSTLTSIGSYCFRYCASLKNVCLPPHMTRLEEYLFYACTSLESVTIGSEMKNLAKHVFENCSNLTSVICLADTPPVIAGGSTFRYNPTTLTIYVHDDVVQNFSSAGYWSSKNIQVLKSCAKPSIEMSGNRLHFTCDTEGVTFHYQITPVVETTAEGEENEYVTIANKLQITVYASAEGYSDSESVTKTISIVSGDTNGDGQVDIQDVTHLVNSLLKKNSSDHNQK